MLPRIVFPFFLLLIISCSSRDKYPTNSTISIKVSDRVKSNLQKLTSLIDDYELRYAESIEKPYTESTSIYFNITDSDKFFVIETKTTFYNQERKTVYYNLPIEDMHQKDLQIAVWSSKLSEQKNTFHLIIRPDYHSTAFFVKYLDQNFTTINEGPTNSANIGFRTREDAETVKFLIESIIDDLKI